MDFDVPEDKDNVQVVSASEQQITLVVTNKQFDNLVETNLSGQIDKTTGKPYTAVESTGKIKITFDASAGNYVATSFEPVAA
jgi:glutamate synthase domain-containing protein 3